MLARNVVKKERGETLDKYKTFLDVSILSNAYAFKCTEQYNYTHYVTYNEIFEIISANKIHHRNQQDTNANNSYTATIECCCQLTSLFLSSLLASLLLLFHCGPTLSVVSLLCTACCEIHHSMETTREINKSCIFNAMLFSWTALTKKVYCTHIHSSDVAAQYEPHLRA